MCSNNDDNSQHVYRYWCWAEDGHPVLYTEIGPETAARRHITRYFGERLNSLVPWETSKLEVVVNVAAQDGSSLHQFVVAVSLCSSLEKSLVVEM